MKGLWWLLGLVLLTQVLLTAVLGPERAWHILPWVHGPAAVVAACLAFYHWLRYRQGVLREQPVPLLPLGLALLVYAAGVTSERVRGRGGLLVFGCVSAWFILAYVRLLLRQAGAALSAKRPNDR